MPTVPATYHRCPRSARRPRSAAIMAAPAGVATFDWLVRRLPQGRPRWPQGSGAVVASQASMNKAAGVPYPLREAISTSGTLDVERPGGVCVDAYIRMGNDPGQHARIRPPSAGACQRGPRRQAPPRKRPHTPGAGHGPGHHRHLAGHRGAALPGGAPQRVDRRSEPRPAGSKELGLGLLPAARVMGGHRHQQLPGAPGLYPDAIVVLGLQHRGRHRQSDSSQGHRSRVAGQVRARARRDGHADPQQ